MLQRHDSPTIWTRLEALQPARVDLTLQRVREAAQVLELGPALAAVRWVLVAGTNGKGSTSTALASILQAHGLRVGLYTSPHLRHPRERIRVDGIPIADGDAELALAPVLAAVEEGRFSVTYFEAITLGAIAHFYRVGVQIGVLEVGLGGRLDATNIVEPEMSVITSVGLDHMVWLGESEGKIAAEKGGIVRGGRPLVTALSGELLESALAGRPAPTPVLRWGHEFFSSCQQGRFTYCAEDGWLLEAAPRLIGPYQGANLGLALTAARLLLSSEFSGSAAQRGLECAYISGRYERRLLGSQVWVFDGAHNEPGARALASALEDEAEGWVLVIAIRKEKDATGILEALRGVARHFVFYAPHDPHAYWSSEALAAVSARVVPDVSVHREASQMRALAMAAQIATSHACGVVVTGSLYTLGSAMDWLEQQRVA